MPHPRGWYLLEPDRGRCLALAREAGISPVLAALLLNRGITNAEEARGFLAPKEGPLHSPWELPDMQKAVARIARAVKTGERILLHGDYDVDGVTGTAILLRVFRTLGIDVYPFLPDRVEDGYGVSMSAVETAAKRGIGLIVTVDCGVSANKELTRAAELEMDVVITDHHEPPQTLPPAVAVVNPKTPDSTYPNRDLAGTGVAFKLAEALREVFPNELAGVPPAYDDVALGTVADVVPLTGENRTLVARGIQMLRETERPGLMGLLNESSVVAADITAETIGYALGPRLNALGRVGDASDALELLLTRDWNEAKRLARMAQEANTLRKRLQDQVVREIEKAFGKEPSLRDAPVLAAWGEGWHIGVVGIVAGRLSETYCRPAFVATIREDGTAVGSARGPESFNVLEALTFCGDLLLAHGGHSEAGGFRLEISHLEEFRQRLNVYGQTRIAEKTFEESLPVDCELSLRDISESLLEDLAFLEPLGEGNPRPLFLARGIYTNADLRIVGNGHLRIGCYDGPVCFPGIAFRRADLVKEMDLHRVDIVFEPQWNVWQDRRTIQLRIEEIKPSAQCTGSRSWTEPSTQMKPDIPVVDRRGRSFGKESLLPKDGMTILLTALESETWREHVPEHLLDPERFMVLPYREAVTARFPETDRCHAVLWDLPPHSNDLLEALKRAKEASRDLRVYLSYDETSRDGILFRLNRIHPDRERLIQVYRFLQKRARNESALHTLRRLASEEGIDEDLFHTALRVFSELELIELEGETERIRVHEKPVRRDLEESETFRNGREKCVAFESLAKFLLTASVEKIHERLQGKVF